MRQNQTDKRPPWSPVSVTLMTFLLPAGGAVLTILNLRRLGEVPEPHSRRLVSAAVGLFALGYCTLIALAQTGARTDRLDSNAVVVLSVGVALASFLAQRSAYRTWSTSHSRSRTGSWRGAFGVAVIYQLVTVLVSVPVYLVVVAIVFFAGGTTPV